MQSVQIQIQQRFVHLAEQGSLVHHKLSVPAIVKAVTPSKIARKVPEMASS